MAAHFELFIDPQACFRFRLTGHGGETVALSGPFADRESAVRGIEQVRECAGMGLVADLTAGPCAPAAPVPPAPGLSRRGAGAAEAPPVAAGAPRPPRAGP